MYDTTQPKNALDEILSRFSELPKGEQESIINGIKADPIGKAKWSPNPGPQTQAYYSEADCLLYGGSPGGGKLLALDTSLPTPGGWTTIGEVQVGDYVFDDAGQPCGVVAKSPVEKETTYRITFSDGSHVVAGGRHFWVTSTRAERNRRNRCTDEWRSKRRSIRARRGTGKRPDLAERNSRNAKALNLPLSGIRTTAEIAATLHCVDGRLNHSINICEPLKTGEAALLVDPYVLGAWLGDGNTDSGVITSCDQDILEQVSGGGYVVRAQSGQGKYGILGLQKHLRQLGVLGNKHIPPAYLRASQEQRLALLQGLMDTDGYCDERGQCEISLTRKTLIDDTWELLISLGIKSAIREGEARLNGRYISPKWRIKFLTDLPVFSLSRKLIRQKRGGFRGTHNVRYISDVQEIEQVPLQCIQVDSSSHMYLCGRNMIPTHNSWLILGLAFNEHQRSIIMRREYGGLERLISDALKINGSRDGFNGSPPPRLRISDDKIIHFRAAHNVGDEQGTMGQGRDFLGIDEATQFTEGQIRFLMGWVRTEDPNQRCRTVLATNPPLTAEGMWVNKMFAPWLDDRFPNPAEQGELRWVITDEDGKDVWVDGPHDTREVRGKIVRPQSRTYIEAHVSDNPDYEKTDYERTLDSMQEPYRSMLMGGFKTKLSDAERQVIPTAWIEEAMRRHTPEPPKDYKSGERLPMTAIGVDVAISRDQTVLAPRYDYWYAPLVVVPGALTPTDSEIAALVVAHRRNGAAVVVDVGGGYGGGVVTRLADNGIECHKFNAANAGYGRTKDNSLGFANKRAEAWWRFREALDPDQEFGSPVALPDDAALLADLAAPTFDVKTRGILIESKEDIQKRLGRSTDRADAVVMAWSEGTNALVGRIVDSSRKLQSMAIMGHANKKRRLTRGR